MNLSYRNFSVLKNIGIALSIGITTSFISVLFNIIIDTGVEGVSLLLRQLPYMYIFFPVLAGIITFYLYKTFLKTDSTGIGIVQVLVELSIINTFLMKPLNVIIKVILSIVTLVFGLSAGRFGPIVHLGSSIGSNIGYKLKMDSETIRLMIGCGAASAIAAVFGMPLFASVFVLEVLFKKQYMNFFAPVVLGSTTSFIISKIFYEGVDYNINIINFNYIDIKVLLLFVFFGFIIGLISIIYIKSIKIFTIFFSKSKSLFRRLVIAGAIVGIIGFIFPLNFEIHSYTTINILKGEFGVYILLSIIALKILTTGITLGSGFVGGNFYPGLTIGAATGILFQSLYSKTMINEYGPLFGVLGIGGMIAGYFNAPLSGIILAIEISKNFNLMFPALIVCSISVSTTFYLYGKDIFSDSFLKIIKDLDKEEIDIEKIKA